MYVTRLMEKYIADSTTAMQVLEAHYELKLAPSQIDQRLDLPAGTAHDIMVDWWAFHKKHTANTAHK